MGKHYIEKHTQEDTFIRANNQTSFILVEMISQGLSKMLSKYFALYLYSKYSHKDKLE